MVQEITPAPANPLEETVPDSPASGQPVTEQPAPTSGPEEPTPVGEEAGAATQPPPWASIAEAPAVLEHEAIRPLVEESNKVSYDKAYADVQGRLQPLYTKNHEALNDIRTTADDILTQLRRAVEDKLLDERAVEDLLRHHRPAIDTLRGVQESTTVGNVLGDLAQRIGFAISPDVVLGYEDWRGGKSQDTAFVNGFIQDVKRHLGNEMLTKQEAEEMAVKRSKKDLDEYKAANAAAQQARGGAPVGAFAPGSPAGSGKYTAEQWTAMTTPQRNKAREEGRHPLV